MSLRPVPTRRTDDHELVALIRQVSAGDGDAFRELHDRTRTHVERAVRRTVRQPDLASEVAQEVFLQVWQHADTYDPARGSVCSWLSMHAHRRAVDRVRSLVRAHARDLRDAAERPTTVDDVAELGIARCEAIRVRAALDELSDVQREALVLTYLRGYSHGQVATHLGIPLGTVKTRVRNGLISLRQHIGETVAA